MEFGKGQVRTSQDCRRCVENVIVRDTPPHLFRVASMGRPFYCPHEYTLQMLQVLRHQTIIQAIRFQSAGSPFFASLVTARPKNIS